MAVSKKSHLVDLSPSQAEKLERIAEALEIPEKEVIERALESYIERVIPEEVKKSENQLVLEQSTKFMLEDLAEEFNISTTRAAETLIKNVYVHLTQQKAKQEQQEAENDTFH